MRKISYILLLVLISLAFFTLWMIRWNDGNKKSPPYEGYSGTIEESKERGLFQFEVISNKSSYELDSELTIEIKNAWIENCWTKQAYLINFGTPPIEKHDDIQLVMNIYIDTTRQSPANHFHYFIGYRHLDNLVYFHCSKTDSIKVPLYKFASSHDIPKRKDRIAFDTLLFVKK